MIHDLAYDRKKAKGALDLFLNTDVIDDDWKFVNQELALAMNPSLDPVTRTQAFILGYGLGAASRPKVIYFHLKKLVKSAGKGASLIQN
jgi:hypothetical protein